MGKLNEKVIVLMAVFIVAITFASTFLVYVFTNNIPLAAPGEGSGKVSVDIVRPYAQAEPVVGNGVVSFVIKPLED